MTLLSGMGRYLLWFLFRSAQFQLPFRLGDELEIRTPDQVPIARLPAAMVESILAHHLDALAMQAAMAHTLAPQASGIVPPLPGRKSLAKAPARPYDTQHREAARVKRRRRR